MEEGYLIRVSDGRATALWVTATGTAEQALEAVRQRVSPTCEVTLEDQRVSLQTLKRLGLAGGQIWHL
jgi:hypothetical protein